MRFWITFLTLILFSFSNTFAQKKGDDYVLNKDLKDNDKKHLQNELEQLRSNHYKYRREAEFISDEYGENSRQHQGSVRVWSSADSINNIKIDSLVALYGNNNVMEQGAETVYWITLHSSIERQIKLLPILKTAAKEKKMSSQKVAEMEDKINVATGKKQIYGTQICKNERTGEQFVCPLENPDNVEARRAELDLSAKLIPMALFTRYYGIKWNVDEYKKRLPEFEAIQKEQIK